MPSDEDFLAELNEAMRERPLELTNGPTLWQRAGSWLGNSEFTDFGAHVGVPEAGIDLKVAGEVHAEVRSLAAKVSTSTNSVVLLIDSTRNWPTPTRLATRFLLRCGRCRPTREASEAAGNPRGVERPPDLTVLEPQALSISYEGCVPSLTAVTTEHKGHAPNPSGVALLLDVLRKRHAEVGRLDDHELLVRLVKASGGNLRNLLILVRSAIARTFSLPVGDRTIDAAIKAMANDFRYLTGTSRRGCRPSPTTNDRSSTPTPTGAGSASSSNARSCFPTATVTTGMT